ncbi:MAG: hypothetical protein Fur0042_30370 [Cyanophyceae cyanobacterium]
MPNPQILIPILIPNYLDLVPSPAPDDPSMIPDIPMLKRVWGDRWGEGWEIQPLRWRNWRWN